MATISNTPIPGYVWDVTDNVWYPIGVGGHSHSEIASTIADAKGDLIAGTAADTVARLAVGTNGQVLTADSTEATGLKYATPSAGAVTLISTTSYSGQSSQAFDSKFTSTYDSYYVLMTSYDAGVAAELRFQFRSSAPATIATGYTYGARFLNPDGTPTDSFGISQTYLNLKQNGFTSTNTAVYSFTVMNPLSSKCYMTYAGWSSGGQYSFSGAMTCSSAPASGFILTPASSTITGTVSIYGVSK